MGILCGRVFVLRDGDKSTDVSKDERMSVSAVDCNMVSLTSGRAGV